MNKRVSLALFLLGIATTVIAQSLDEERIGRLALQFLPEPVRADYAWDERLDELENPIAQYHYSADPQEVLVGNFAYLSYQMPNDPAQYLLLAWRGAMGGDFFFRLLKSLDGGSTFGVAQDSPRWYGPIARNMAWRLWLSDLTADGVPELIMEAGEEGASFSIFQWKNGEFVFVCPTNHTAPGPAPGSVDTALHSNGGVDLLDVDGDGKAEVLVHPWGQRILPDNDWVQHTPWKLYKYDGNAYTLGREIPNTDPFPISVPSIAAFHPTTLPLSELSNPGNGKLRVFVSDPAGTATVDDYETAQFKYGDTALSSKKRWTNNRYPTEESANFEWGGCPVKQAPKQGQGPWTVNPSDPAVPSPDGATEYHFVGPYLELELPRSAVFPYLLQAATDAFAKEPTRETYFIEVPISGKMKNGKLAAVSALVCINQTGPAKPS